MNKRIKELAEQAGVFEYKTYYDPTFFKSVINDDKVKKFAELIVKQCRDTVAKTRDQAIEDEWNVEEAMSTAMYDIEQHFGA
jgi:hypothetical protein